MSLNEKIEKLKSKYDLTGQKIDSYLEGLLLSNYLSYWDYVHLDTLLTLQTPQTDFPDEKVFIVYHQITELYFNLCLHELEQISNNGVIIKENGQASGYNNSLSLDFFKDRLTRINRYFESLTKSFDIMVQGMEVEQFTKFRMALLPASGFQSAQYRKIEIAATPLYNLVSVEKRNNEPSNMSIEELFEHIYWKQGAIDLETSKKTYTLEQFEKKYSNQLIEWAHCFKDKNIWLKYQEIKKQNNVDDELIQLLKTFDYNVNVGWPLVHLKSAARYLQDSNKKAVEATGGTNWRKYLAPRLQKRIFFPELYTKEEIEHWGKPLQ